MPGTSLEELESEALDAETEIDEASVDDEVDDEEADALGVAPSPPSAPRSRIAEHVGRFSDRAVQRVVGSNAFLRGRQYARRGEVQAITTEGASARGRIQVKTDVYEPAITLMDDGAIHSSCSCPGFRGATGHCKHVAALLVALRDRERPPRSSPPVERPLPAANGVEPKPLAASAPSDASSGALQTVSAGGKRRRPRRRRRGEALEPLAPTFAAPSPEVRLFDAWLPTPEEERKPLDMEFRMQVRPSSLAVTPVVAGTRTGIPILDALASFQAIPGSLRPIMRLLGRHAGRGAPTTAEVRGEDAAELLGLLKGHRVLLEPASMELRFADDPLRPRLELDQTNGKSCRVRVVFETKNGIRRFPLSSGVWFEGTPSWQLDTTEGVARPLVDAITPAWLARLHRSPALVYSMSELPRMLTELVPRVAALLGAELPDISQVADIVDEQPRIRLTTDGDILAARAKFHVIYGDQVFLVPPGQFASPLAFLPPNDASGRPRVVRRDVGAEMAAVQLLANQGFAVDETKEGLIAEGDAAIAFWTQGIAQLPVDWEKLVPSDLRAVKVRDASVAAAVRVSSGVDWLSLDVAFTADGLAVDEDELRGALEKGRKLVKLADGSWAPVRSDEVAEVLERLAEIVAGQGSSKIPLSQAGRVQELLQIVGNHTVTPQARELFGKLGDVGEIELVAKPRNLKVAQFRDYQRRGFSWLAFLHGVGTGGILADDMGLGKTLQTIALLLWVKSKSKEHRPSLVVAPTSVVPNWAREIEKFAPSLSTLSWHGAERHEQRAEIEAADVVITSYALLRRDEELLSSVGFRYVILDEAQHIKNPLSATARAAKRVPSERRLALTGTPIENRLSEIWSIMDFVSPGLLGSLKAFEERYARPIERGDEDTIRRLRTIVRPLVMRRTKSEVAPELPSKIEQEIVVPLAEEQNKLYKQMLGRLRASVLSEVEKQGVSKAQIQILAALTRLRQAACDPRLTKLNGDWSDETSGKLAALREILGEATSGGHRALVFSQFVEMLQLIRAALDQDGVSYEYLDGSTKDRQERVDRFNGDESVSAFLISLKAGGTGLNLTGADTVIHFDPWWNPAVEDQATDRAHRIGQTKVVTVYRLIARGTVEEKILQLSEKKRDLMENVLSNEGAGLKGLTKADIDALFSE